MVAPGRQVTRFPGARGGPQRDGRVMAAGLLDVTQRREQRTDGLLNRTSNAASVRTTVYHLENLSYTMKTRRTRRKSKVLFMSRPSPAG